MDSAIFPQGTSGAKLDVLARKALWQDGLNYMVSPYHQTSRADLAGLIFFSLRAQHGTGHGFGSFLNVHEGPQSFSSDTVLVPGHVLTNEPGFCESSLSICLPTPRRC